MRLGGTSLAAAALSAVMLLSGGSQAFAAESEAMGEFRRLCVATAGDVARVRVAAEREGWTPYPEAEADNAGSEIEVKAAFVKLGGQPRMLVLMTGEVQPGLGGHGCLLGVARSQAGQLNAEAAALARVAPHPKIADDAVVWVYSDSAKGRQDLSGVDEETILDLAETQSVQAIFLSDQDELVIIALIDVVAE